MSYFIPLDINGRNRVVRFTTNTDSCFASVNSFIHTDDGNVSPLFRWKPFHKDDGNIYIDNGDPIRLAGDKPTHRLFRSEWNDRVLTLHILPVNSDKPDGVVQLGTSGDTYFRDLDNGNYGIFLQAGNEVSDAGVRLIIHNQGIEHCVELRFHVAKQSNIYRVAYDYGSESSQIGFCREGGTEDRLDFFSAGEGQELARERNDRSLYRTGHIYLADNEGIDPWDSIKLDVLAGDKAVDNYKPVRNLKLLRLLQNHGPLTAAGAWRKDNRNDLTLNERGTWLEHVFPMCHLGLFRKMLARFDRSGAQYSLRITLLVPNVYSFNHVAELEERFAKDLEEELKVRELFMGFELLTISESDAAFKGQFSFLLSEGHIPKNSRTLIIDIGKGTIDATIVEYGSSVHDVKGLFRCGVAGAGQAITFAYLDAWLDNVSSYEKKRSLLTEMLEGFGNVEWNNLFQKLDESKQKAMNDLSEQDSPAFENLKSANEHILKGIKFKKAVLGSIVQTVITEIADSFQSRLKSFDDYSSITHVLFTGRGGQYEPLRTALIQRVQGLCVKTINESRVEGDPAKTTCIRGAIANTPVINGGSMLIPVPDISQPRYIRIWKRLRGAIKSERMVFCQVSELETKGVLVDQKKVLRDLDISIGDRRFSNNEETSKSDWRIVFNGLGFVALRVDSGQVVRCFPLIEDNISTDANEWLIKKSLFPLISGAEELITDSGRYQVTPSPNGGGTKTPPEIPISTQSTGGESSSADTEVGVPTI